MFIFGFTVGHRKAEKEKENENLKELGDSQSGWVFFYVQGLYTLHHKRLVFEVKKKKKKMILKLEYLVLVIDSLSLLRSRFSLGGVHVPSQETAAVPLEW